MSSKTKNISTKEESPPALVPRLRFPEFRDEAGWAKRQLSEITTAIFDGTHQTPTYTDKGVPFYSVENLVSGNANKFISSADYEIATKRNKPEKGDVLITRIGKIGYSQVVTWSHDFSIYVTLAVIKKDGRFNSQFLHQSIQSATYQKEIFSKSLLSAVPCKINMDSLRATHVLLASPAEQQKIAECLSSVDELIAAQARKLAALKTHKKGLMRQLFPREGETQPRLRFPEFQNAGEWEEKKLGQLAKYTKGFPFKSQDYKNEGIRIVRVSDLGADFIKPNNEMIYIRSESEHEYERYKLTASEIIVTTVGSKAELVDSAVGRGIYVYSNNEGLLNQNLLKLEVLTGVNSRFLFAHINTPEYQRFIASISRGNANQANIAVKDLMGFTIKAPHQAEQQRIADCLTSLDDLIAAQTQKLEALKTHKKGLMQQLFPSRPHPVAAIPIYI